MLHTAVSLVLLTFILLRTYCLHEFDVPLRMACMFISVANSTFELCMGDRLCVQVDIVHQSFYVDNEA